MNGTNCFARAIVVGALVSACQGSRPPVAGHPDERPASHPTAVALPATAAESKVLIVPVTGEFDASVLAALSDLVAASAARLGHFDNIITLEDVQAQLAHERMKDVLGCDDVTCATEIGGALGVRFLLTGRARVLGSRFMITLTLIDTSDQKSLVAMGESNNFKDSYKRAVDLALTEFGRTRSDKTEGNRPEEKSAVGNRGSSGPKPGFRGVNWGTPPDARFDKLDRLANMDVYVRRDDRDKRVAGVDCIMIKYLFYKDRLCRVDVDWLLHDQFMADAILATLEREWGPGISKGDNRLTSYLNWTSADGVSTASAGWMHNQKEGYYLSHLQMNDRACTERATNDAGL